MLTTYFNICEKRYIYWDKEVLSSKMFMCKIVRRVMVIAERIIQTQVKDTGFANGSKGLKNLTKWEWLCKAEGSAEFVPLAGQANLVFSSHTDVLLPMAVPSRNWVPSGSAILTVLTMLGSSGFLCFNVDLACPAVWVNYSQPQHIPQHLWQDWMTCRSAAQAGHLSSRLQACLKSIRSSMHNGTLR